MPTVKMPGLGILNPITMTADAWDRMEAPPYRGPCDVRVATMRKPKPTERGGAMLEFALICPVWVPLLLGTMWTGFAMIRELQVQQVARDAASIFCRGGTDFSDTASTDAPNEILTKMTQDIGSITSTGTGVLIFSTLTYVGNSVCTAAGAAYHDSQTPPQHTAACTNYGHFVFTQRYSVGHLADLASQLHRRAGRGRYRLDQSIQDPHDELCDAHRGQGHLQPAAGAPGEWHRRLPIRPARIPGGSLLLRHRTGRLQLRRHLCVRHILILPAHVREEPPVCRTVSRQRGGYVHPDGAVPVDSHGRPGYRCDHVVHRPREAANRGGRRGPRRCSKPELGAHVHRAEGRRRKSSRPVPPRQLRRRRRRRHRVIWRSYNLQDTTCGANPCIVAAQDDQNKRRTVTVTASVQVPLLFMRIMGFTSSTVAASGMAARRDVVLVLVLDRSSSMSPTMASLRAGATYFVQQFQPSRDRLGLVVFGGSAIIAYPSTDWLKNPQVAGLNGPDTSWANTPDSAAVPNIYTSINNIVSNGNTGTAEGLMYACEEIKAANQPGALNVIVLFTDGQPNGITANFNNNTGTTAIRTATVNPPASTCTYKPTDGGVAANSMIGWMAQINGFVSGGANDGAGIFRLMQLNNSTQATVSGWLKTGTNEPLLTTGPGTGCSYEGTSRITADITIPTQDLYGNATQGVNSGSYTTSDYKKSEIWGNECNNGSRDASQDLTQSQDACEVGLASWNAADQAARQIHGDTTYLPVIYCLGYQGNGGDDPVLMRRLANVKDPSNTVFDSTKPQGMYLQIQTVNDISPAFQSVLAEILRLTLVGPAGQLASPGSFVAGASLPLRFNSRSRSSTATPCVIHSGAGASLR